MKEGMDEGRNERNRGKKRKTEDVFRDEKI